MEGKNNKLLQVEEKINEMEIGGEENNKAEEQRDKRISRNEKMLR